MVHPLVSQLHFARDELLRGMQNVPAEDALKRFEPMNCLSWIVGHLASQEHYLWVIKAQGVNIAPDLIKWVGFGKPASTPDWDEMWDLWRKITHEADKYLETVTDEILSNYLVGRGENVREDVGTTLLRNIYHYWFHLGEAQAIRQIIGHPDLATYVGYMDEVRY
jgi:hypothetical protein